jgi:hypothetical protein
MSIYHEILGVPAPTQETIVPIYKGHIMQYSIIGSDGFVYGKFPTKICATLALEGMSTMLDNLTIKEIK